jgi:hypothetical protein
MLARLMGVLLVSVALSQSAVAVPGASSSSPTVLEVEACRKARTEIAATASWAATLVYDIEADAGGSISKLRLRPSTHDPGVLVDVGAFETCIRRWKFDGAGKSVITLLAGSSRAWHASVQSGARTLTLVLP